MLASRLLPLLLVVSLMSSTRWTDAVFAAPIATTYYVDRNHLQASDSNPGTKARPWLTIQHAGQMAAAGDTVIVKAGVYPERVTPQHSGLVGQLITIKALPRRSVTMWGFYTVNADYLRIEGFIQVNRDCLTPVGCKSFPRVFGGNPVSLSA